MCFVAQSCLTLCDLMDCSLPGSSVLGDSPGKNNRVSCLALLQGIFPIQGLNPGLLHCRQILYRLSHQGLWVRSKSYLFKSLLAKVYRWIHFQLPQLRVDTYTSREGAETIQKESYQIVYGYHSSILAWRIPWMEKPGWLQSIGSQRVKHNRSNLGHTHAPL